MNDKTVNVMDQFANAGSVSAANEVQTPMQHVADAIKARGPSVAKTSVTLAEMKLTGLLVLRANASRDALSGALKKVAGIELPETLESTEAGAYCARWMTPDEWLLSCPNIESFDIEKSLRTAVEGHLAIVNNTGGYSVMRLYGNDARNVLKKSTVYDVSPENFQPGKVVNTTLAKAQVTLRALPDNAFELVVRRSFADYVWLWLQRAGREYNMQFKVQES
ncbi:MAG: sarcosine oxidase subunit gamma [bacterium]|jgi:sarcosine oxidase subunit gamma